MEKIHNNLTILKGVLTYEKNYSGSNYNNG